jgi:hypothetical protein
MKTVVKHITTAAPLDVVVDATMQALRRTGGQIMRVSPDTIKVTNGSAGVQFSFVANINADVNIRAVPGGYDITAYINNSPSMIFWICAVAGWFVLGVLWLVCLLYFFIDPTPQYNQILDSIQVF